MTATVSTEKARADLSILHAGLLQAASLALKAGVEAATSSARGTDTWKDQRPEGGTRSTIEGKVFGLKGFVKAGGASKFLESGTAPHIIRARNAKALRFVKNGAVIFRKWVHHPGTRATHFMTEARNRGEQAATWGAEFYASEAIHRI